MTTPLSRATLRVSEVIQGSSGTSALVEFAIEAERGRLEAEAFVGSVIEDIKAGNPDSLDRVAAVLAGAT